MLRILFIAMVLVGSITPSVQAAEDVAKVIRDLRTLDRHLPTNRRLNPEARRAFEQALGRITTRYYRATGSAGAEAEFEKTSASIKRKLAAGTASKPAHVSAQPIAQPITDIGRMVQTLNERYRHLPRYQAFERQGVYSSKDVSKLLHETVRFGRAYREFQRQYKIDLASVTQYQPGTERDEITKKKAIDGLREHVGAALRDEIQEARTDIGQDAQYWLSYVTEDVKRASDKRSEEANLPSFPISSALQTAFDAARIGVVLETLVGGDTSRWEDFQQQAEQHARKRGYKLKERLVPTKAKPPAQQKPS